MISAEVFTAWLGKTTWQVSLLILLVLFVQWTLQNYLTPRWRYFLWFLVLARMALPALPESPFSLFNVIPEPDQLARLARTVPVELSSYEKAEFSEVALSDPLDETQGVEGTNLTAPAPPPMTRTTAASAPIVVERPRGGALAILWGMGALLFLAFILGQSVATQVWYGKNRIVKSVEILEVLENCRNAMGIRKEITVLESPARSSPALMGMWRPTLLLPAGVAGAIGRENLRYVFLHELAHVKRRDIGVNWLATFLLSLHWFNPLAWYALRRMRSDQELACDDYALRFTRPGEAKRYGETVIRLLESVSQAQNLPGMAGILEDKSLMRRRIQMIVDFRKPGPAWTAVTVSVCLALGLSALTEANSIRTEVDSPPAESIAEFPEGESLGSLWIRDWGSRAEEDWVFLAKAQGAVTVPASKEVAFLADAGVVPDLTFLSVLNPEAVRKIDLEDLEIESLNLEPLASFPDLLWLSLKKVKNIDGAEMRHLARLTDLQSLNLYGVQLNDQALSHIEGLSNLEFLNLEKTGATDEDLASLSELTNLTHLTLSDTEITDEGLAFLEPLERLEYLDLWSCDIGDEGLAHIANLISLKYLELVRTRITDKGIEHLTTLRNLESLFLDETQVTDGCLPSLAVLPSLRRLLCQQTDITPEGLRELGLASPPADALGVPKVGIVFSHRLTTFGYDFTGPIRMAYFLREGGLDLYSVIEKGTLDSAPISDVVSTLGLQDRVIESDDVEGMKELDAILCVLGWVIEEELIDSLIEAVEAGTGFMNMMPLGFKHPGYSQNIQKLLGVSEPHHVWERDYFLAPVINYHPILGMLDPGDKFWIRTVNGYGGVIDGTPLLGAPDGIDDDYYPLYVRELGEGRVVVFQVNEQDPTDPRATPPYSVGEFYVRCINWAAKRPPGAKWTSDHS